MMAWIVCAYELSGVLGLTSRLAVTKEPAPGDQYNSSWIAKASFPRLVDMKGTATLFS